MQINIYKNVLDTKIIKKVIYHYLQITNIQITNIIVTHLVRFNLLNACSEINSFKDNHISNFTFFLHKIENTC